MKNTTFLDYYKTILEKVSFDPFLLAKEYHKALSTIHPSEIDEFQSWVKSMGYEMKLNGHGIGQHLEDVG